VTVEAKSFALVRPARLSMDSFCRATGLHPDLVRRLVALDLLEAIPDSPGGTGVSPGEPAELWFSRTQVAAAGRLQRLRNSFALNYAALGLVVDLLDRIAALETALRNRPRTTTATGGRSWT
jgi:chaperone modulatory protein CbpM